MMTALVAAMIVLGSALLAGSATAVATSRRRAYVGRHRTTW